MYLPLGVVLPLHQNPHRVSLSCHGHPVAWGNRVYLQLEGHICIQLPRGTRPSIDLGGTRVYPPLGVVSNLHQNPMGRPYPLASPCSHPSTGGTRVYPLLGGTPFQSPRASLAPHGPSKTEGTRVYLPLKGCALPPGVNNHLHGWVGGGWSTHRPVAGWELGGNFALDSPWPKLS